MKIKKEQVIPGFKAVVQNDAQSRYTDCFTLDQPDVLFGRNSPTLLQGDELEVLKKPSKSTGINLVKVKRISDGAEGNVFYTDFVYRCTTKDN